MSFDEYAAHIYQKHRLCVAIAVLKAKPPEMTSTEFLQQLKNKMAGKMADNMVDDDVTICSDDFMMDFDDDNDDSVIILEDFDDGLGNKKIRNDDESQGNGIYGQLTTNLPTDLYQTTYCNTQEKTPATHFNNPTISKSLSIPTTYASNNTTYYETDENTDQQTYIKDILPKSVKINKKSDNITNILNEREFVVKRDAIPKRKAEEGTKIKTNNNRDANKVTNNKLFNKENVTNLNKTTNFNETQTEFNEADTNIDTQKTILYTVHGFTQNTHYSASQTEISVPKTHLYGNNNDKFVATVENSSKNVKFVDVNSIHGSQITNTDNNTYVPTENENKVASINNVCEERSRNTNILDDNVPTNSIADKELHDINEIIYSQEFEDIFNLNQNVGPSEGKHEINKQIDSIVNNLDDYFDKTQYINDRKNNNTENLNTIQFQDNNRSVTYNIANIPEDINNYNITNSQSTNLNTNLTINNENSIKNDTANHNFNNQSQNFGPNIEFSEQNNTRIEEIEVIEEELELIEVIPYKVLEELNKVKTFLRRRERRMSCDGNSTDSGYRSDSQRSSNRSALQLSGISINQSAHCLLNHIMQCPLVHGTKDITTEIAQTLGQLIDRLHEEESYPPFLEELLDTTDILLRQIYKAQNIYDNEFLKKEEFIQRLLLLNKSIHIQQHTIEKITNILINFHQKVTDKNVTYELTNIDEIENSSYIFHILEILIKKYVQIKDISCSNTQSQDEERILKKSSITDIWRKKWNPNLKVSEGSRENRCVLKSCSEILNKIVVECVNLYSVVAYAALKCFNCIQS